MNPTESQNKSSFLGSWLRLVFSPQKTKAAFFVWVLSLVFFMPIFVFITSYSDHEKASLLLLFDVAVGFIAFIFILISALVHQRDIRKRIGEVLHILNNSKTRTVLWIIFSLVFIVLPIFYRDIFQVQDVSGLSDKEKILIGEKNLWRIVFWTSLFPTIFGLLSLTRRGLRKFAAILGVLWILGSGTILGLTIRMESLDNGSGTEFAQVEAKLPAPEGNKDVTFNWKYQGKDYTLSETLYDSYYNFYRNLPANIVVSENNSYDYNEKLNQFFVQERTGDETIKKLANDLRDLGAKNKLNDNQLAELALTFVETIPYDYDKFNNRQAGLNGIDEKITFPYEVLYDNTGVCQDKSYLAYALFKELGYGVAIFLFQHENHMAIGIKCPQEYSSYDSGYCFAETTSLGNRIGTIPEFIPQKGIAVSNREFEHFGNENSEASYSILTNIGIFNQTDGKTYTGIVETIALQKQINTLQSTLYAQNNELKKLRADLDEKESSLEDKKRKLDGLFKKEKYEEYMDYYKSYKKVYDDYEKDRKAYNKKVDAYNQMSDRYNILVKSLYQ